MSGFLSKGANFINIIHPTALIGRTCKFGTGMFFAQLGSYFDVTIGDLFLSTCIQVKGMMRGRKRCTLSSFCDITVMLS